MPANGRDCSISIKTACGETDIPFSDETIQGAVSILKMEAPIEGDGRRGAILKTVGTTGCVITPLTIGTAPLLLSLALGAANKCVPLAVTGDFYRHFLDLAPMEDSGAFDLVQERGGRRVLYEGCRVRGFELRIARDEAVKLRLDVCGGLEPRPYPYAGISKAARKAEERFHGRGVTYSINGKDNGDIYGLTAAARKEGGTQTELWMRRVLRNGPDMPHVIDELAVTAKLARDVYGSRYFGTFRICFYNLVKISDETNVNSPDAVIGPVRYYVSGPVTADVFSSSERLQ